MNKTKDIDGNENSKLNDHHEVTTKRHKHSFISIFSSIFKKKRSKKKKRIGRKDEEIRPFEERNSRFQNGGVIINLFMLILFAFSIYYQSRLTTQSLNLSKQSFEMAKTSDSIDNVQRINDNLARERIAKMELRAYLSIADFKITSFSAKEQFKYMINLKNTGKTPAQNISVLAGSKRYRPDVFINDFDNLDIPVIQSATSGGSIELQIGVFPDLDFTEKDINEITIGKYPLYVLGTIYYEDVFGDKHYTRYCRQVIRESNGTFRFEYYKKYNEEK